MADEISEYTVRDYSAMDRQIDEIARRERILTNRLNLENLKRFALIGLMVLGGVCLLILALAVLIFRNHFYILLYKLYLTFLPFLIFSFYCIFWNSFLGIR